MTSPEPPVKDIKDGKPVYYEANAFEPDRVKIFKKICEGALSFISELCDQSAILPQFSQQFAIDWINGFLMNPTEEDRKAFAPIRFSTLSDHSDSIPLAPFEASVKFPITSTIERLWLYARKHPTLYALLHTGKSWFKRT